MTRTGLVSRLTGPSQTFESLVWEGPNPRHREEEDMVLQEQ
jgi:hypothetical protein